MKPIFIIRFPFNANKEELNTGAEHLHRMGVGDDYHIIVTKDKHTGGEIKFECYNTPHTEIEFIELKKRIISLLDDK